MIDHLPVKTFPMIDHLPAKPFPMIDHRKRFDGEMSDHLPVKTMSTAELYPTVMVLEYKYIFFIILINYTQLEEVISM